MEIRDTIQSDDIRCDGWIDKDTAEASIRQTEATLKRHTPVYDWMRKLLQHGQRPDLIVLEAGTTDWRASERRWIARARAAGLKLLNLAEGGDQPACPKAIRQANGRANARNRCPVISGLLRELGQDARFFASRGDLARAERSRRSQGFIRSLDREERARFAEWWSQRHG